ncbi:unnamed protein product [Calypogeia fissa]
MTTVEGTAVEATQSTGVLTNHTAGQTDEEVLKVEEESPAPLALTHEVEPEEESVAPLTLPSEGESVKEEEESVKEETEAEKMEVESVKETEVAVESNISAVEVEPVATVDVKVETVKEFKEEERNGGESKVFANGNSEYQRDENGDDSTVESDGVTILPHWYAKPCVHITGLGGIVTEEDLVPCLSPHGKIVSIVFENDRRDSVIVRYEPCGVESDDVVAKVRETINNTQIKDRTLVVEPFRPDALLFIGNLTPEIDDAVLRQMFEPHGTVERAFVLRNVNGRSKSYGFVEYSLKSQASAAKVAMGNINMDGRVLRVEWSDCRKISDMFSTVLFVDRIAKDNANIEQILRNIFGKFGRVRDCHLAIGINQQFRGFGFIDFYQSILADKAHEALDGKEVEGSNIRVSFANPSKSALSYKSRFGTQAGVQSAVNHARGTYSDQAIRPGGPVVGATIRSPMGMPVVGNRYLAHGRSNILGMSIGMQFGRGAPVGPGMIGRNLVSPLIGAGAGMLGPGSVAAGMIGRGPGLILGHTGQRALVAGGYEQQGFRLSSARGPVPISSVAIAQVATAQAKAREEEAKARAAAQTKQSQPDAKQSAAEQERLEQFRKIAAQQAQLTPQRKYYQQQSQSSVLDQLYEQGGSQYSNQQPYQQTTQVQRASHTQYQQQPSVQQAQASQQSQQSYNSQYYSLPTQQYVQQAQQQHQAQPQSPTQPQQQQQQQQATGQTAVPDLGQYSQQQAYFQKPAQPAVQAAVSTQSQYAQYAQQYGQQYAQQYQQQQQQQQVQQVQQYGHQPTAQQYTEATQQQAPAQYTQQDYASYYAQQQQPQTQQAPVAVAAATAVATPAQTVDASQQQQAYAAYYQQRAQEAVGHAGTTTSQTTSASTVGSSTSLEAQWAAYYAAQAAHQQAIGSTASYDQQQTTYEQQQAYAGTATYYQDLQQPSSVDSGQKRTADQIDYTTQAQATYSYQQQPVTANAGVTQQQAINGTIAYQQQAGTFSVQQQPAAAATSYQQSAVGYPQQSAAALPTYPQQASATSGYVPAVAGGYQPVAAPSPSGYQQSGSLGAGYQQPAAALVSAYGQSNQTAVQAAVYDYSKRPRYQ